ncbi:MAG: hypothetical protein HYS81_04650 [Candidatus Aenigmatarchaeota archaeon]|nr:MAG: hypothetical protein HYS81_04650 [Candidatus Aenigmarchaeota archaeon]
MRAYKGPPSRLEHLVDKTIPFALVILLVLLVFEFFFVEEAHAYEAWVNVVDLGVIAIFATDLWFKYKRLPDGRAFVRTYWLEIVATIPFFLAFRLFELLTVSRAVETGQEAVHAAVAAEEEAASILRTSRTSRYARFTKFLRVALRAPRFAKAAAYFKAPHEK